MTVRDKILIISCEHAVNTIPKAYQAYFKDHQSLVDSHRGIDFGAGELAFYLSETLNCPLFLASVSRLLIDCNRSLQASDCFSEISALFTAAEKEALIQTFYLPYCTQVRDYVQTYVAQGHVVWHISVHSFTPCLNNIVRTTELGLLYDCKRSLEKKLVLAWQKALKKKTKAWRVRLNYPYKGGDDGLVTALRTQFNEQEYVGIEIECNQALTQNAMYLLEIKHLLASSLKEILAQ